MEDTREPKQIGPSDWMRRAWLMYLPLDPDPTLDSGTFKQPKYDVEYRKLQLGERSW